MSTPNEIDMVLENGEKIVLFKPLEPYETPEAVERLCDEYNRAVGECVVDPLILIPNFILDFLCIHPFNDDHVIIRTKLEKPSKINGLALI